MLNMHQAQLLSHQMLSQTFRMQREYTISHTEGIKLKSMLKQTLTLQSLLMASATLSLMVFLSSPWEVACKEVSLLAHKVLSLVHWLHTHNHNNNNNHNQDKCMDKTRVFTTTKGRTSTWDRITRFLQDMGTILRVKTSTVHTTMITRIAKYLLKETGTGNSLTQLQGGIRRILTLLHWINNRYNKTSTLTLINTRNTSEKTTLFTLLMGMASYLTTQM